MAKGQNDQADIRVVVGVKGGHKVDGESGSLISKELSQLAQELDRKQTFKLSVGIHTDQATQTKLQNQLNTLAKGLKLNVDVTPRNGHSSWNSSGASRGSSRASTLQKNQEYAANQRQRFSEWTSTMQLYPDTAQAKAYNQLMVELEQELQRIEALSERVSAKDKTAVSQKISRMRELHSELSKTLDAEETLYTRTADAESKLMSMRASFNQYLTTIDPKAFQALGSELNAINGLWEKGTPAALKEATEAVRNFKATVKTMGYEGGNFITYLQGKIKTFTTYLASTAVTGVFISGFANMKNSVIELDDVLTDLMIVTGDTRTATEELLRTYNKMAQQLGSTTALVGQAAVEWQRQGYNLAETNALVNDSMVLSVVGMVDSADAASYLTSAIKGYNVEIRDAIGIVDKLTAIDMAAAVSAGGLAEAMARTANSARLAGVDMNSLLGYIAAIGEVTQRDMATVGESMKTIFARYGNVKLGVMVDEESGESLNDFETALSAVGIALRDQSGSFRDFNEVMLEVADSYEHMSDVERSALATTLGGIRQRENVLVLLENMDKALKYTGIAADSAGTAMQKFATYQESLEAKANKATAAFENMATSLLPTGLLGAFYDLQTVVYNTGAMFGGLPATIISTTAAIIGLATAMDMLAKSSVKKSFSDVVKSLGTPIQIQIGVNNCA